MPAARPTEVVRRAGRCGSLLLRPDRRSIVIAVRAVTQASDRQPAASPPRRSRRAPTANSLHARTRDIAACRGDASHDRASDAGVPPPDHRRARHGRARTRRLATLAASHGASRSRYSRGPAAWCETCDPARVDAGVPLGQKRSPGEITCIDRRSSKRVPRAADTMRFRAARVSATTLRDRSLRTSAVRRCQAGVFMSLCTDRSPE